MAVASVATTAPRDLVTGAELTAAQLHSLLQLAAEVKAHPERFRGALSRRFLALLFEKPSLRTRVSFEIGMQSLGGGSVFLDYSAARMSERETVKDLARNLERWVDVIAARTYLQSTIEELADNAKIPVINGLSDRYHPCQILADFQTLEERFGNLRGFKLAFVGDGNNVCHSLLLAGARLGVNLKIATPPNYKPDSAIVAEARLAAKETKGRIELLTEPAEAVSGAQAVYTDVWASMGQEQEASEREKEFSRYQVNDELMAHALPDAVFMHCLPAHRGLEVTETVLESPRSIVYDQAENRMHAQKALLLTLLA
ncbi:MAG TPA: ornithine carbamoyltransferase [Candidatus Acidoferrales bacterium]|nr:ornithine carbamoyltransferase [Candidatus Acidoferrales bacterium]